MSVWWENLDPKTKCWWMLIDYLKAIISGLMGEKNNLVKNALPGQGYALTFILRYNVFYDDRNKQLEFENKLKNDGIYDFIKVEYGKNAGSYAIKVSFNSGIKEDELESMIGLFALLGYTESLNESLF